MDQSGSGGGTKYRGWVITRLRDESGRPTGRFAARTRLDPMGLRSGQFDSFAAAKEYVDAEEES